MANNFDMFTKKGPTNTSENLPYAFSHISAGAPPAVYMSMMTGNTFDEAMRETNNIPMSPEELDIDLALDPELDDPDALEKAIYQLRIAEEKEIAPEEVLETPYGPGLSGEEIDLLLDAYPALDAGIDLDMIEENFDEVDRLLGKSGENIEGAMDAVEQRAEDEGEIGATPLMMRELGDSLGGSLEPMLHPRTGDERRLAGLYTNSPFDSSGFIGDIADVAKKAFQYRAWETQNPFKQKEQYSGEFGLISRIINEPTEEGDYFTPKQVIAELKRVGITGRQGAEHIEKFLTSPEGLEIEYDVEDALKIFAQDEYVQEGPLAPQMPMAENQGLGPTMYESPLLASSPQAQPGGTGLFDAQPEGVGLVDAQSAGAGVFGNEMVDLALTDTQNLNTMAKQAETNLSKVFYTRAYAGPVSPRLKAALPQIFNESKTLFYLYEGQEAFSDIQGANQSLDTMDINENLGSMEKRYGTFLTKYLTDPSKYRSGKNFQDLVYKVRKVLNEAANKPAIETWDTGLATKDFWISYMFGPDGVTTAETNRMNLIKMNLAQGQVHAGTPGMYRMIEERWARYKQMGWSPDQIFNKMVDLTKHPSATKEEIGAPDLTPFMAEDAITPDPAVDAITPDPAVEAILAQPSFGGGPGRGYVDDLPSQVDSVPDMAAIEAILDQVPLPQQAVGPAAFGGGPGRGGMNGLPEVEVEEGQGGSPEYPWLKGRGIGDKVKKAWSFGDISNMIKMGRGPW